MRRGKNEKTARSAKEGQDAVRERAALAHLREAEPRLYAHALLHRGAVFSRVLPKRTNLALFRSLVSSIVSQQLSTKAAQSIFKRLEDSFDGRLTPEAIADASPALLRQAGLSQAKIRSLKELSSAIAEGRLSLLSLKRLPPQEAVAKLTALYGIGPWTAEMFLIFALGAPDIFSPGDLILARTAARLLELPERTSKKELARIAERWAPHRSFVSLLLWKVNASGA